MSWTDILKAIATLGITLLSKKAKDEVDKVLKETESD